MIRLLSFLYIFFYCIFSCLSQKDISQLYVEKSRSKSDTAIIHKHLEIADILTSTNPDAAYQQIDTAYLLAIEKKYKRGQVKSLVAMSKLANNNLRHSEAVGHLNDAIVILSEMKDVELELGKINHRLGHTYNQMSRYYEAIDHYQEALNLFEELNDTLDIANTLTNIGIIHINLEDRVAAVEHYDQAAELYRQIDHKIGLVYYYNNIGHINYKEKKYDLAIENYNIGLELAKQTKLIYMEGHICGNLGLLYRDEGDHKTALDYLEKERNIYRSISNESKILYSILAISKIKFDDSKNIKYLDSIEYCLDKAKQSGDLQLQENALKDLEEVHSYLQDYQKAYYYQSEYYELKNSTSNNQLKQNISSLKLNHEIQRIQRAKESEIGKAKLMRNLALGAVLFLVFFSYLINRSFVATKKIKVKLEQRNKQLLDADRSLDKKNKALEKYIDSNIQLKQFAHIASHDIKSPLRTILSFSSLLKRNLYTGVGQKEKEYFDAIETGAKRITELVEDLLEYSTLNSQELSLSTFSIHDLIEEVCEHLTFSIRERNVDIINSTYESTMTADRTKIKQVIQNLLDNAIKFSASETKPCVEFSYEQNDLYHEISISDNGIGIDTQYVKKIFNEFVQLNSKDKFEGTGLGLSICKNYITKHGGQISVYPRHPKGSIFTFTIKKNL